MKTISKPTRLLSRLWVFSCLLGSALTSCQTSQPAPPPRTAPTKAPAPTPSSGYLGLTLPQATAKAAQEGRRSRVIMIDGQRRPVTKDYRPSRLNFAITQGKVVAVTKG